MLGAVWAAYDVLGAGDFRNVGNWNNLRDLERDLTEALAGEVRRQLRRIDPGGYLAAEVEHGPCERETQRTNRGQPPEYDIAFKWLADDRIMWPLEAKVLADDRDTDAGVGEYVDQGVARFLDCRYAPFVTSGAMLGYLKTGDAETVVGHVSGRLGAPLLQYPLERTHCHKTSDHHRAVPPDMDYPIRFRCHHLIMPLSITASASLPGENSQV